MNSWTVSSNSQKERLDGAEMPTCMCVVWNILLNWRLLLKLQNDKQMAFKRKYFDYKLVNQIKMFKKD